MAFWTSSLVGEDIFAFLWDHTVLDIPLGVSSLGSDLHGGVYGGDCQGTLSEYIGPLRATASLTL